MMTKQMAKQSMDDLPWCNSAPPPPPPPPPAEKTRGRGQDTRPNLFLVSKAPCKRTQHCWPTTSNIVGCYMLRPFAHTVACCCVLLGVVAQSLKPVKLLGTYKRTQQRPQVATI